MSDSNQPEKEKLPAFKTVKECIAYCDEKGDNFYLTAFMLEAWMGRAMMKTVEQYAEHKSGDRHLQTGTAWEAWQFVFGHAAPEEWPRIMESLGRFANCDSPDAKIAGRMLSLAMEEDKHGEAVFFQTHLRQTNGKVPPKEERLRLARYAFERMSEWLEAILHWRAHWMSATAPITNQPTEEQRELAHVGITQGGYAGLSEHSKEWWRFRHGELAKQFHGKRDWLLVGKAQSFEKWGELRQPAVDELTIHWWPLLKRYRWTDHDMRGLLRRVVPHPDSYPLREDKEFADYRKKALGLIKGKEERDKSAPDGKPIGWRVALAMIGKLSE
jgi:hypothetical protein